MFQTVFICLNFRDRFVGVGVLVGMGVGVQVWVGLCQDK